MNNAFMPAPPYPIEPRGRPDDGLIEEVAGPELARPLARISEARTRAVRAIRALEDARHGETWQAAARADAEAAASGITPKRGWATAELLTTDHQRWAEARACFDAVTLLERQVDAQLDKPAIANAGRARMDLAGKVWAAESRAGWNARMNTAAAWQHRQTAGTALSEFFAVRQVTAWAEGMPEVPPAPGPARPLDFSGSDRLPTDPVGRGHWLALEMVLRKPTWFGVPRDVQWPEDLDQQLFDRVIPGGRKYVNLAEKGHHAVARAIADRA